jgi:thymidylate synthase
MKVFTASNSTEMAIEVYDDLRCHGIIADSRNGRVLKFPEPVTMRYTRPWERMNFTHGRDSNPFFHLAESMWMLAGRNDVEFLDMFNSNMKNYSDDGETFNAAYGYRARHEFGIDQLKKVAIVLARDPDSRQAVVQLWHPNDLAKDTKDKACNMSMVFSVSGGELCMTVYNRSNDAVFGGVTGANPVHFSYFQQWIANRLELDMGDMYFVSNNLHVYLDLYPHWDRMEPRQSHVFAPYPKPLSSLEEIERLCNEAVERKEIQSDFESEHLNSVIVPVLNAFLMRKYKYGGGSSDYLQELRKCTCESTYRACIEWLHQRNVTV